MFHSVSLVSEREKNVLSTEDSIFLLAVGAAVTRDKNV